VPRPPTPPKRFVFVDRDGVINVERGDYTLTEDQWRWAPGSFEGLKRLREAGFAVIVVTNQSCIAKGLQTEERLSGLHDWMRREIEAAGGSIEAVYHCPHWRHDACDCRKPQPGMLLKAAGDYGIDLAGTFFIGDAARDMEAGKRAGTRTIFIRGTTASEGCETIIDADFTAENLADAADIVIRETAAGKGA